MIVLFSFFLTNEFLHFCVLFLSLWWRWRHVGTDGDGGVAVLHLDFLVVVKGLGAEGKSWPQEQLTNAFENAAVDFTLWRHEEAADD